MDDEANEGIGAGAAVAAATGDGATAVCAEAAVAGAEAEADSADAGAPADAEDAGDVESDGLRATPAAGEAPVAAAGVSREAFCGCCSLFCAPCA